MYFSTLIFNCIFVGFLFDFIHKLADEMKNNSKNLIKKLTATLDGLFQLFKIYRHGNHVYINTNMMQLCERCIFKFTMNITDHIMKTYYRLCG